MGLSAQPPFRADQVGSLLRVPELRAAHEKALQGQVGAAALRELQDRCIRDVIGFRNPWGSTRSPTASTGAARFTPIS